MTVCRSRRIARSSVAGSGSSVRWLDRSRSASTPAVFGLCQARPDALIRRVNASSSRPPSKRASVLRSTSAKGHGLRGLVDEHAVRARREDEDRDGKADDAAERDLEHRSAAETSGSALLGLASSMMAAVAGAIRMLWQTEAAIDKGMIAATNPSTSGILVHGPTTATAAPTTAPPTVPTIRSILAASVPPTLLCMTMTAVITAQNPCGVSVVRRLPCLECREGDDRRW
jgi:hypothetical protein